MSKESDQIFVDVVTVVIGALVLFTILIGILSWAISDRTIVSSQKSDPTLVAETVKRIAPIGAVLIDGVEAAPAMTFAAPAPAPVAVAAAPSEPRSAEQVYNLACVACHGAGIAGAPATGDAEAWAPRIAQGMDVLAEHAINGYQGEKGIMPAKGGNMSLSDDEVVAAIDYMVAASQ